MTAVFEFNEVTFSYYEGSPVLTNVTLAMEAGAFVAVVGPNGAGKSTLLKLCVGLLQPLSGDIRVLGVPCRQFKNWSKIGYIPQGTVHNRVFPATIREVVAMGRVAPLGLGSRLQRRDYQLVDEVIARVGLSEYQNKMIAELSGGQLQRTLIARALAAEPAVLVLDEATSGVDSRAKDEIYTLLKNMNTRLGLSVIMVAHDVEHVLHYVDKVADIKYGLQYYGNAAGFSPATYKQAVNGAVLAAVQGEPHHA